MNMASRWWRRLKNSFAGIKGLENAARIVVVRMRKLLRKDSMPLADGIFVLDAATALVFETKLTLRALRRSMFMVLYHPAELSFVCSHLCHAYSNRHVMVPRCRIPLLPAWI